MKVTVQNEIKSFALMMTELKLDDGDEDDSEGDSGIDVEANSEAKNDILSFVLHLCYCF